MHTDTHQQKVELPLHPFPSKFPNLNLGYCCLTSGILFGVGIGSKKPMVGGLGWWFETNLNPYDLKKTTFTGEYITFGFGVGFLKWAV